MGEIAEMMLDGILDDNGEYTGMDLGYTYRYYKGNRSNRRNNPLGGVRKYLSKTGHNGQKVSYKAMRKILLSYATLINFPPIGNHQTGEDWDMSISEVISKDWKAFVNWFKENNKQ